MKRYFIFICILLVGTGFFTNQYSFKNDDSNILSYIVNPTKQELKFYWKDQNNIHYENFENLRSQLSTEKKELVFAMNGGMYNKNLSPQGLYIENNIIKAKIDTTKSGYGNFYLQPNGIFYLTKENKPVICTTRNFSNHGNITYATIRSDVVD